MEIKKVAVLGSGIMAGGIAQVTAAAGYQVVLRDIEDSLLQGAMAKVEKSLSLLAKAGKLAQDEIA